MKYVLCFCFFWLDKTPLHVFYFGSTNDKRVLGFILGEKYFAILL